MNNEKSTAWMVLLLWPACVLAGDPPFLRDARLSWAAFECSALAEAAGDEDGRNNLRKLGVDRGRSFIDKAREDRFPLDQLASIVPNGMSDSVKLESTDLVIGSYSRTAQDFALDRMRKDEKEMLKRFSEQTMAFSHFRYRNCHLLQ